jgi:hypothetical protein
MQAGEILLVYAQRNREKLPSEEKSMIADARMTITVPH